MTFARCIALARRWSKVTSSAATDAELYDQVDEAIAEFARDVGGLPMETYLELTPLFDLRTTFAINVNVTDATLGDVDSDLVVGAANVVDQTGAETAALLQTAFQTLGNACASWTVTWANYKFTIGNIAATTTALEITAPDLNTYSSAVEMLFGGTQDFDDVSGTSLECDNAMGSQMRYSLPSSGPTMGDVTALYWNGTELPQDEWDKLRKGEAFGDPCVYAMRNDEILLYPNPTDQYECYLEFLGGPVAIGSTDGSEEIPTLKPRYHMAIAHRVAWYLLEEDWESDIADRQRGLYLSMIHQYKAQSHNQKQGAKKKNTAGALWYRVQV